VNADPRSQCQQTDDGGGGFQDADTNALTDDDDSDMPGLGDAVAFAIKVASLGTITPCPACEVRRKVLNKFGRRLGQAALRRIGY